MRQYELNTGSSRASLLLSDQRPDSLAGVLGDIPCSSRHIIIDANAVAPTEHLAPGLLKALCTSEPILITASESNKTLAEAGRIASLLQQQGADRDSLIIAVGGGITTDLAGFTASVFKRGVRLVNVPTTLLAQVDAAIGGKNGVNLGGIKNVLGTIVQPLMTCSFTAYLDTLPRREILEGAAELLKTFLITSAEDYTEAVRALQRLGEDPSAKPSSLGDLVFRAACAKAGIVSEDQYEHGRRTHLNLGHTFAHAIETATQGRTSHGEAVSIGIILAALTGRRLGITPDNLPESLMRDFALCSLPTDCPVPAGSLLPAMLKDKKMHGSTLNIVIPVTPGHTVLHGVPSADLGTILHGLIPS